MSDIIHFIKAGNVNLSSAIGGPDPQFKTHESATQADSSGVSLNYDNRFPEQYVNLVKRDTRFYAGGDPRYILMSGDSAGGSTDAETLDGEDGSYYLDYANFSGVAGAVSGNSFTAPSGNFTNLTVNTFLLPSTTDFTARNVSGTASVRSPSGNFTVMNIGGALSAGSLDVNGTIFGGNAIRAAAGNAFYWSGRSQMLSPGDGRIVLVNSTSNGFSRLTLGPEGVNAPAFVPSIIGTGSGVILVNNVRLLDFGLRNLSHSGNYTQELNLGTSSSTRTIYWTSGNTQVITLGAATTTFTFSPPDGAARLQLMVKQDNSGGRLVAWPINVKWPAATAPTLTASGNAEDIIAFWYNGTNYYGTSALAFG